MASKEFIFPTSVSPVAIGVAEKLELEVVKVAEVSGGATRMTISGDDLLLENFPQELQAQGII